MEIDLNAPAFGEGSQTTEPVKEPVAEPDGTAEKEEESKAEIEENKVPYTRFKKFHDRALEAEQEAAHWRKIAETTQPKVESQTDLPSFWVELYGDSDASKKAWKIQSEQNEALLQKAREEALNAVRSEKEQETAKVNENIEYLDQSFESLSSQLGRDLTDKEQAAVLDIIDDYTPKDEEGNYAGAILPFDKAWEIYNLKETAQKAPRAQKRDAVASLSQNQSQGEVSVDKEKDKNFNPLDWNAWRSRI
jgi:hypothetical protein